MDAIDAMYLETITRRDEERPIHALGDGKLELRGRKITPRWARVGLDEGSRATVALMVGESEEHAELLMLTVPDARVLIAMLADAVHAPLPTPDSRRR